MPDHALTIPPTSRFIGRNAELEILAHRLRRLAGGAGGSIVITGEAGIGKTRLLGEALAHVRGVRVLRGAGHQLECGRPLGPLAEALGLETAAPDTEQQRIARMLYDLHDHPASLASGMPSAAHTSDRYRAVDAMVGMIGSWCQHVAVVLVLEDLHWADASTLEAVHIIARRMRQLPLLLVVTVRPVPRRPQLEQLLEALSADGGTDLMLNGLDLTETELLAAALAGAARDATIRARLTRTGGNPELVTELMRALRSDGLPEGPPDRTSVAAGLSPGLRLVVLRRLSDLQRATQDLLRVAAVLGPEFEVTQLARVTSESTVRLLPLLEDALCAGVLDQHGTRLTFKHELIWEAVYADLAPAIRSALHAEAGRVLADGGASALQVADHLMRSAEAGDLGAVQRLHTAAKEALTCSPGPAASLLQRATTLAGPGYCDPVLADLVVARLWSGRAADAELLAKGILDRPHAPSVGERVRIGLVEALCHQGHYQQAVAEADLMLGDPRLAAETRAQLRAELAHARLFAGDAAGASAAAATATEEARRVGDDRAACTARTALSMVALYQGHTALAVDLAANAESRARRSRAEAAAQPGWPHAFSLVRHTHAMAQLFADRPEEADRLISAALRSAEALGTEAAVPLHAALRMLLRYRTGRWDEAIADAAEGWAQAGSGGIRSGLAAAYGALAMIAVHRNELTRADELVRRGEAELVGQFCGVHWLCWARGLCDEACGDPRAGLDALERAWASCTRAGMVVDYPLLGPDLIRAQLAGGDTAGAAATVHQVEEVAGRMGSPPAAAAALRCSALLHGDPELAGHAVRILRDQSYPLPFAQACEEAAGVGPDAAGLLGTARDVYRQLGARRNLARVQAQLRMHGVRCARQRVRGRGQHGWDSLTGAEREIVALATEGLTNREIAQRLFISPRTVETHLSRVFGKLGVSGRPALRLAAARRATPVG